MQRELRTCPVTGVVVVLNEAWPPAPPVVVPIQPCWSCGERGPLIQTRGEIRAIPHPTPILGIEGNPRPRRIGAAVVREGVGAHELVFGRHDHADSELLSFVADRIRDLRGDPRLRGFLIRRTGRAGDHRVWHLVALPFDLPPAAPAAWRDAERELGTRVLAENAGALAVAAFAPTVPFETWVVPRGGIQEFPGDEGVLAHVTALVAEVESRIHQRLGQPEVQVALHDGNPWRIVLRPQFPAAAPPLGPELPLVGVFPERAAKVLRGG